MHIAVRHALQVIDPADPSACADAALVLPMREAEAVMGETVAAYLARVAWRFDLPTVCRINGEYYARAEWATRAIAANDDVEFLSRPLGGGSSGGSSTGKTIMAVVAMIALTAIAGPAGGAIAGTAFAAGTTAYAVTAAIASAVIVGAGSLALSHFLRPKSGGKTASSDAIYSFGLQGNASRPMQPIPVLNGRLRFAPDYAAPTYSEFAGEAMTDYALYALTCGRMRLEQVLIGDTPIWDWQTGYSPDYPGIELQLVEPGDQVTLYPVNVVTADEMAGVELSTTFTPGTIVNAAGTTATELLVDFVWSSGAYQTYKDRTLPANTDIVVEARKVDAAGAATTAWAQVFRKVYSQAKPSQIRVTERIPVEPGRYEVRARRQNPSVQDAGIAKVSGTDNVTWSALRAHIDGPQSFPRVTVLAVKGVASKQLSGVSGGQLRVIGTRILPVWKNGGFVEEPTRSIAWAALDWWRNGDYSAGLDLSNVDFQAFVAYDALWASLGHSFDRRFTEVQTLDEVLETVLKAGRAFPAPIGDKLTLTRDQPRGLSRMLFTDNDIVAGSLEIKYALADAAWADGIVGEYVDQTTWRLAEVSSAPDGVTLTRPARIQLDGVVDRKQATGLVRFAAAESQYRRITVSWTARMEGRLLKRGDLVRIATEEPETWGQSCEIVAIDGFRLTLDPAPEWEPSGTHYVEIRQRDGRPFGPVRVTRGASDAVAIVNSGDAGAIAGATGITLADAVARRATQEAPWCAFSPGQPRSFPVLVTEGDPDEDGEHIHLKGVWDAPEVHTTTETGVPPLLEIPDLYSSALPRIEGLNGGVVQRQLTLVLTAGWQAAKNAVTYVADVSYDAGTNWVRAYEGDRTTFEAVVGGSDRMRVRVAGVTPGGVRGGFSAIEVDCPDLIVSNAQVGLMKIDYVDLTEATRGRIEGAEALAQSAEAAVATIRDGVEEAVREADAAVAEANAAVAEARDYADGLLDIFTTGLDTVQRQYGALAEGHAQATSTLTKNLDDTGRVVAEQRTELVSVKGQVAAAVTQIARTEASATEAIASLQTAVLARFGLTNAAIVTETSARATADAASTRRMELAESSIGANAASILTEATTRATKDEALAQSITTLTGKVGDNAAGITRVDKAYADGDTALAQSISTLSGKVGDNAAGITRVEKAYADADTALSQTIERTYAKSNDVNASITSVRKSVTDGDTALSERIDATYGKAMDVEALVGTEITARSDGDTALGQRIDVVSAKAGDNAAAITATQKAVVDGDKALSDREDVTYAKVMQVEGLVGTEIQARADADSALGQRIDTAQAKANDAVAGVTNEATARVQGDKANADAITDVYSRTDRGTAFGRFAMSTVSAPSGVSVRLAAQASTESYGQVRNAGWFLDLLPDGSSRFVIDANLFAITNNGGVTYPFTFDGTTLVIPALRVGDGAFLRDALSQCRYAYSSGSYVEISVYVRARSKVMIWGEFDGNPGQAKIPGTAGAMRIERDSTPLRDRGINYFQLRTNNGAEDRTTGTSAMVVDEDPHSGANAPGWHTYKVYTLTGQTGVSIALLEIAA